MRLWDILRSRLRSIVFPGAREADLRDELQLHLEREIERLQAGGLTHEDARHQALRLFGGVEQIKEASRTSAAPARGTRWCATRATASVVSSATGASPRRPC
jgi:hypothetical protein